MADVDGSMVPLEQLRSLVHAVRGQQVLLDSYLARMYGVTTAACNQPVRRNPARSPSDFVCRPEEDEWTALRSRIGIAKGRGGRRTPPYAFTEQGVARLRSVLNSERAVLANIAIMRAFVRWRQALAIRVEPARGLAALEQRVDRHDNALDAVLTAIRQILDEAESPTRRIGFRGDDT